MKKSFIALVYALSLFSLSSCGSTALEKNENSNGASEKTTYVDSEENFMNALTSLVNYNNYTMVYNSVLDIIDLEHDVNQHITGTSTMKCDNNKLEVIVNQSNLYQKVNYEFYDDYYLYYFYGHPNGIDYDKEAVSESLQKKEYDKSFSRDSLYSSWKNMMEACFHENDQSFYNKYTFSNGEYTCEEGFSVKGMGNFTNISIKINDSGVLTEFRFKNIDGDSKADFIIHITDIGTTVIDNLEYKE